MVQGHSHNPVHDCRVLNKIIKVDLSAIKILDKPRPEDHSDAGHKEIALLRDLSVLSQGQTRVSNSDNLNTVFACPDETLKFGLTHIMDSKLFA